MTAAPAALGSATIDRWRQAIRSGTLAHYQYQMGIALARTGEMVAALASFERALVQEPGHAAARLRLIAVLEEMPDGAARARALREEGMRLDPQFPATGSLVLLADDLTAATAADLADRIILLAGIDGVPDPVRGPILHELGQLLVRTRLPDKAEAALALAHRALPTDAGILSLLSTTRLQLGRLGALAQDVSDWLALAPGDPDALFHRARLHLLHADFAAADADLRAVRSAGRSDAPLILSFQIRSRLAAGDPAGALAMYEMADQAGRNFWICRANALIARLRLGEFSNLTADSDGQLQADTRPLAQVVRCLIMQKQGGDWRPQLSRLLQNTPSAFTFAAAAVLEWNDGATSTEYWHMAKSFPDPFARFYLMTMSADYDQIAGADR